MRAITFLFLLTTSFAFAQKKECNCHKYRTGTYYTLGPGNDMKDTLFITRGERLQNEQVGEKYSKDHRVIWISDCKFVLRDQQNMTTKKYHTKDAVVKIIETGKDYYVVKAWAPKGKKMTMTFYRIKE